MGGEGLPPRMDIRNQEHITNYRYIEHTVALGAIVISAHLFCALVSADSV